MIRSLRTINVSFWCSSKNLGFHPGAAKSFEASTPLCAGVSSEFPLVSCPSTLGGPNAATAPANAPAFSNSRRFIARLPDAYWFLTGRPPPAKVYIIALWEEQARRKRHAAHKSLWLRFVGP